MVRILSLLACCYCFSTAAVLFVVMTLLTPFAMLFDPQRKLFHFMTAAWGWHHVILNPFWECRIEGAEFLERDKNYVIVANHQSLADIFVISGLWRQYKWVSKESLLNIPFFGWNMRLNEYIAIKRGDIKSIKEMMATCKHWLQQGVSIMMFPEGTRSDSGELGNFRDGSFRLSLECDVPVVPVVITGTKEVIAKHSRTFNFASKMRIKVLPPVLPETFKGRPAAMRDHVHQLMKSTLHDMRKENLPQAPEPVPLACHQSKEAANR